MITVRAQSNGLDDFPQWLLVPLLHRSWIIFRAAPVRETLSGTRW
jgi:hypothetical protein